MKIDVLSLFPKMFAPMQESIIGKAIERGALSFNVTDFRDYTTNKHNNVDDYPFGGGAGMLLTAQPIFDAIASIKERDETQSAGHVILLDPAGAKFDHQVAERLAKHDHLTFICGHYEGYDERIKTLVDEELSLGDYVLTGGELGAMVMIDATVRFLPDVLGNRESASGDSFQDGLLEYPQYTRPADFRGMRVPDVLISGNHQKIADWRLKESLKKTYLRRPDLLENRQLTKEERDLLDDIKTELAEE
ncbi:tRNA (guanosine(37)-N1)-methyltransferase TrmD [Fructobacillus fructosus]|uniref:tRNA (guanine-N(1)-)-methyltransferase n=1 Tax=Fructobacillus fructosus TaxID=1631 RepID=A0ABN9YLG6_9LACO|nr:tRNA (guanosine(37)-N1)-methyltransferase TrmD [Fructobacillus fructosus]MBD9364405.1 tRNA (guanosine(37)-N1)-methyltransferase TrmD [Leuconostoc mesenteroides]MCH9869562.1 tRNA (guanosine(37)-N1)-methyltransferase TrmD [Serratia marcescens]KRN53329.1 tRNA (guanine-N(1)-)-methyltransferase [Fructobacillus fructosus KCTC 3544]MBC9118184.1 tRNA (guanosine(37)-N1)-methyltransferase TrmD [Fructobacillus fructosus]MCK8638180.1 tRNA (guanosine(37)-N1)-methyltransferase TrmD [Fructobacillus fructo